MNFVWIFKKLLKILKMRTNSNFLQKSANSKREGIFKYLQISNCKVDFCKKIASSKRESEFSNICKFQSLKFWILSEYLKNCNRKTTLSIWCSLLLYCYLYCGFEFIDNNVHSLYFASYKVNRCYIFRNVLLQKYIWFINHFFV